MDPVLELQGQIIDRLRTFSGLTSLIDKRSYDIPPLNQSGEVAAALFPYVSIGFASYATEDADCVYGGEITFQIDAWSVYQGTTEVRKMAHAIRSAFRDYEFSLDANALVTFDHLRTDFLRDGMVKHAAVRFTAVVEEH